MNDSEIQNICQRIYKNHNRALDLIFEYKPDIYLNIYNILLDLLSGYPDFLLDDSSKGYIRFIPKELDFIPKEGSGWGNIKRIVMFELKNLPQGLSLYLIIGPGPEIIRKKIYEKASQNPLIFNKVKRSLSLKWFTIYKKNWTKQDELIDSEEDEICDVLKRKIDRFKENDLPKIINELKDLKFQE